MKKRTPRKLTHFEKQRKGELTGNPSPSRLAFSNRLRANQTIFEQRLWDVLKRRQHQWGIPIWRQTVIQGYIIDFYFPDHYIGVELDGRGHDIDRDFRRDKQLLHSGVRILRFPNPRSVVEINDVLSKIYTEVRYQSNRKNDRFPQKERESSFLQDSSNLNKELSCWNDERSGNVEKARKQLIEEGLVKGNVSGKFSITVDKQRGCRRQVFASMSAAEMTMRALAYAGISAKPEKCARCGLIHLEER